MGRSRFEMSQQNVNAGKSLDRLNLAASIASVIVPHSQG
jgi:hypothetical protein